MKICLINPPYLLPDNWKGIIRVSQQLGLAYVAAALEKAGYDVSIIDSLAEDWKSTHIEEGKKYAGISFAVLSEWIRKISPDAVGITTFTSQKWSALRAAKAVKDVNKKIAVFMGGPHISVRPEDCLSNENVDFVVMNEGEISTVEALYALQNNKTLSKIEGIGYKKNNKLIFNERRQPIENLDSVPFPARHSLPMKKYFEATHSLQTSRVSDKKWASMITSRGCPYKCIFCSIHLSMGRKWRARSPENIIGEIENLVSEYKIKEIIFEDDNMSLDRERMKKICDMIIDRKIKIEWNCPNGLRADKLDESLLQKMKHAGCTSIFIGAESGVQEVLDKIIGKNLDLKKVKNVVVLCKKIGIRVGVFFVLGLPGETKEDMKKTIDFGRKLRKLGAASCSFFIANPFYGTRLYKIARELGYLIRNDGADIENGFLNLEAMIKTPQFSPEEVYALRERAMGEQDISALLEILRKPSLIKYYFTAVKRNPKVILKLATRIMYSTLEKFQKTTNY
jgi:magnesium-protoporphyrin IX monomethyl ester (oxidative) cyclase